MEIVWQRVNNYSRVETAQGN